MAALLMATMVLPGWGQSQLQGRFPLTEHQVAQTLSSNGILTGDEQVILLAKVVASEPSPALDILSVEPLGDRSYGKRREARTLVKLACHAPGTCLPFYSIVTRQEAVSSAPSPVSTIREAGNAVSKSNAAIIMRPGTHATLVMDDARSHVQVTVVSLENGIAGHKIHVASPDHKQVYVAEVVSSNLLKRSF